MKLYHGTSEAYAGNILKEGIFPRSITGVSNWKNTIESSDENVYLTTAYAGYFASQACKNDENWLILEIDTDKLVEDNLLPDEDYVAQQLKSFLSSIDFSKEELNPLMLKWVKIAESRDLYQLTEEVKNCITEFKGWWEYSIEFMGVCCYRGVVTPEAITKAIVYNPNDNLDMTWTVLDPTISIANYRFCGPKYREIMKWFMLEEPNMDVIFGPVWFNDEQKKYATEVITNRKLKVIKGIE